MQLFEGGEGFDDFIGGVEEVFVDQCLEFEDLLAIGEVGEELLGEFGVELGERCCQGDCFVRAPLFEHLFGLDQDLGPLRLELLCRFAKVEQGVLLKQGCGILVGFFVQCLFELRLHMQTVRAHDKTVDGADKEGFIGQCKRRDARHV